MTKDCILRISIEGVKNTHFNGPRTMGGGGRGQGVPLTQAETARGWGIRETVRAYGDGGCKP
jgi:hypothetical protein